MDKGRHPRSASEWLVELLDRPDDGPLASGFAAWLEADAANRRDWQEIAHTYGALGLAPARFAEDWVGAPGPEAREQRLQSLAAPAPASPLAASAARGPDGYTPRRHRLRGAALAGLATLALAACLTAVALPGLFSLSLPWRSLPAADFRAGHGEIRRIALEDGSVATLAPETALLVDYDATGRHLRLLKGQAFFEVTRDPARPFRVESSLVSAEALGTAFEVRLAEGNASVSVHHGKVRVESSLPHPPLSEIAAAGQWLRLSDQGQLRRGEMRPGQVAAWRRGQLIARDRPVAEVVEEIGRFYGGIVILHGDRLADQTLTGVYNLEDPESALRAVANALGATTYASTPWLFVMGGD